MTDDYQCLKCNALLPSASSAPDQPIVCPKCGQSYHLVDEDDEDNGNFDIAVKPRGRNAGVTQPSEGGMGSRCLLQGQPAGELACTFLAIAIAIDVAVIATAWSEASQPFFRMEDRTLLGKALFLRWLFQLLTLVQFLRWYWYAHKNLSMLFADGRTFNPGLAVISYFIPIVSIVAFYRATAELWKASDPELIESSTSWKESPPSSFVLSWWIFSLTSGVINIPTYSSPGNPDPMAVPAGFALLASLASAVVAYLQIRLIRSINRRQMLRSERLGEMDRAEAEAASINPPSDHA